MSAIQQAIEDRLATGLLGQWYAVAKSVQVQPGRPHAVRALGRNLVLWRGEDGRLKCVEDRCPHRGAPLSRGEVIEGDIACRYHGVIVDGTGTIVRVPAMPDCPLEGKKAIKGYAVGEGNDAVFVYMPSAARPEAPPLDLPPEFNDPTWTSFLCMSRWDCDYRYAIDNLADPMHGSFLHADSFTLAFGEKRDLMRLEDTKAGFVVSRVAQQEKNFDWTEMVTETTAPYCRLDIPYPAAAGPGGPFRIIGFVTPIDGGSCYVFFWRMRQVSGLARESWRFLYRTTIENHHWNVLEQDRDILEAMPDDARDHELLYQHDIGVSRMRRILAKNARDQVTAEQAAANQAAE
ncbi:MAG TPA: aromatic ring-hydroxylating dioxygenase subunit alpha [Hyphomicrobiales bacterium]|nr:aromatic ring-hydroxylating dioxygenase subunit alpha [Hyphomicrobiales bacterium]